MGTGTPEGIRTSIDMGDGWSFRHETDEGWRKAIVPMPWQAQFADLRHVSGRATYRRSFPRSQGLAGRGAVLHFGAVSYLAIVRVNGTVIV